VTTAASDYWSLPAECLELLEGAVTTTEHLRDDVVAPEARRPFELQEDLRRCQHRRRLPADHGEDLARTGSWPVTTRQAYAPWSCGSEAWPTCRSITAVICSTSDGVSLGAGAASTKSTSCHTWVVVAPTPSQAGVGYP